MAVAALTLTMAYVPDAEAQRRGWGPRGVRPAPVVRGPVYRPAYGGPRYGYRRGWRGGNVAGAAAAGLLGAAVIGSIIAAQQPQPQCYRELAGYNRYGRPFYRDVCQ